jgi:glyceraldehyde 3-phosphate dehydrogenase
MRRARAAGVNIVPTTTGAAISATQAIPSLKGKFNGLSIRVPTPVGSLSDFAVLLKKPTTKEELNQTFITASQSPQLKGILMATSAPLVSSDIVGNPASCIIDLSLTQVVDGNFAKIIAWYDNEFGYSNRLVEQVAAIGKTL